MDLPHSFDIPVSATASSFTQTDTPNSGYFLDVHSRDYAVQHNEMVEPMAEREFGWLTRRAQRLAESFLVEEKERFSLTAGREKAELERMLSLVDKSEMKADKERWIHLASAERERCAHQLECQRLMFDSRLTDLKQDLVREREELSAERRRSLELTVKLAEAGAASRHGPMSYGQAKDGFNMSAAGDVTGNQGVGKTRSKSRDDVREEGNPSQDDWVEMKAWLPILTNDVSEILQQTDRQLRLLLLTLVCVMIIVGMFTMNACGALSWSVALTSSYATKSDVTYR